MQGDEIRALRRLWREQGPSSHVFMSERDGPMTPKAFHALFGRIGSRAKMQFLIHPHIEITRAEHGRSRSSRATTPRYSPENCYARSSGSITHSISPFTTLLAAITRAPIASEV
jgi:hypothetical protein